MLGGDVIFYVASDNDEGFFDVYSTRELQESDTLAEVLARLLRGLGASENDFTYGCFLSEPIPDVGPRQEARPENRIDGSFFYGQHSTTQEASQIDFRAPLLQLRERFSKYVLVWRTAR